MKNKSDNVYYYVLRIKYINEPGRAAFVTQGLKEVPGGDGNFEWSENAWEHFQFLGIEAADTAIKVHGGMPILVKETEKIEKRVVDHRRRHRRKSLDELPDNPHLGIKLFGYGPED